MVIVVLQDIALAAEIDEIIVTARKREQPIIDAPVSVSALTNADIEVAGANEIRDITRLVPSLTINRSTGPLSDSYFIRRIGTLGSIPNFEPAVGVFVDGALRTRNGAALGDLYDISRVEVLRGPQTTLYGKNTTAGVISVATNPPIPEFLMRGRMSVGWFDSPISADSHRLEAIINGPLSERTSARFGLLVYGRDDISENLFTGHHSGRSERYSARAQVRYLQPSGLDARLIAERYRIHSSRTGDHTLYELDSIRQINAAFGVPCQAHRIDERKFCRDETGTLELTTDSFTLNAQMPLGSVDLAWISGLEDYTSSRRFDVDQLNIGLVSANDRQRARSFSQEVRISGITGQTSWLAGGFYHDTKVARGGADAPSIVLGPWAPLVELVPGVAVGEPGDSGYVVSNSRTHHLSLFAGVEWAATDRWVFSAAARWQNERKSTAVANFADHARPTVITVQLLPDFANTALDRKTRGTSWEVSGRYRMTDTASAYLLLTKGFKSGGFNGGFGAMPPSAREFDDETVRSIELGLKAVLFDRRLRAHAAVFAADYDDFHSAGWESLRFLVNNAERVHLQGIETDVNVVLGSDLSVTAALSYVDAKYDRYSGGSCSFDRFPDNATRTGCDLSGHSLPFAPDLRASVGIRYAREVGIGTLFLHANYLHSGDYTTNASLDSRHVQKSHGVADLRVGLRFEHFDVTTWVRNVSDRLVVVQEGPSNLFARDSAYGRAFAPPRSYGITVRARSKARH